VLVPQAILNVTRDATRVADLLEDFFTQQQREVHGDPGLKDKFMEYMAAQANTSYSVVDNKLSWVLWLYSLIWMPLLIVMCFMRASRSARPPSGSSSSGKAAAGAAHQQLLLRSASTASTPRAALSAAPNGLLLPAESVGGAHQQELLRNAAAAAAAEQRRRSSGGSTNVAAGSGRGLRRYASVSQHQQQRNSSSDSLGSQQLLPPSASLPAHLLIATGSSSSLKAAAGGSSSRFGAHRLDAAAADGDVYGDVHNAADQHSGHRGSTEGPSTHVLRSSKARLQREAVSEQYGWRALS
jgi:hypothetical protein